jgi:hypothetical protein
LKAGRSCRFLTPIGQNRVEGQAELAPGLKYVPRTPAWGGSAIRDVAGLRCRAPAMLEVAGHGLGIQAPALADRRPAPRWVSSGGGRLPAMRRARATHERDRTYPAHRLLRQLHDFERRYALLRG